MKGKNKKKRFIVKKLSILGIAVAIVAFSGSAVFAEYANTASGSTSTKSTSGAETKNMQGTVVSFDDAASTMVVKDQSGKTMTVLCDPAMRGEGMMKEGQTVNYHEMNGKMTADTAQNR